MACYYDLNALSDRAKQFVKKFKEKYGDNNDKLYKFFAIFNDNSFRKTLIDKNKGVTINLAEQLGTGTISIEDEFELVENYYNKMFGDLNNTIDESYDKLVSVGYFADANERHFAVKVASGFLQSAYRDAILDPKFIKLRKDRNALINRAIAYIKANGGAKVNKLIGELFFTKAADIKAIRSNKNLSDIEQSIAILELSNDNTYVFWRNFLKEINNNAEAFFEEVTRDPALRIYSRELTKESNIDVNILNDDQNTNTRADYEDFLTIDPNDVDQMSQHWDDGNGGIKNNAFDYLDSAVRAYLGSLKVLRSTEKISVEKLNKEGKKYIDNIWDVDTDNLAGVGMYMDANSCVDMIYHRAVTTSADEFVRSIEIIARQQPGFEAFAKFAEDMRNDDQLKLSMFKTFGLNLVSKTIVVCDNGKFRSEISNLGSTKDTAFRNELLNNIKHTALNINHDAISAIYRDRIVPGIQDLDTHQQEYNEAKAEFAKDKSNETAENYIKEYDAKFDKVVADIAKCFNSYFKGINDKTIMAYALDGDNKVVRLRFLSTDLQTLLREIIETESVYRDNSLKAYEQYRVYKRRVYASENDDLVDRTKIIEALNKYNELSNAVYITSSLNTKIKELVRRFVNYTDVSSNLNSMNVHNNMSSDVVDNNYFSYLTKMVASGDTELLRTYLDQKFQGGRNKQYAYSNILVNRPGINRGLFEFSAISTHAKDLIRFKLFDGTKNNDNDGAASYAELSHNDFLATTFVKFFKPDSNDAIDIDRANGEQVADYFARTPADSPRIMSITMPRYSTGKIGDPGALLRIDNSEDVEKKLKIQESFIQDITGTNVSKGTGITLNQAVSLLTSSKISSINLGKSKVYGTVVDSKVDKTTKRFKLTYSDNDGSFVNIYVTGKEEKNGEYTTISNIALDHTENIKNAPDEFNERLRSERLKNLSKAGEVKFVTDKSHPVFKQLKNIFLGEINTAAQQLVNLFKIDLDSSKKTTDGSGLTVQFAVDSNGRFILKDEYAGENSYKLVDKYHANKVKGKYEKGTIFDTNSQNGFEELSGNVFHSDRFVVCTEQNGETVAVNFGDELLTHKDKANPVINYLSNGTDGLTIQVSVEQDGAGNTIVNYENFYLKDEQSAAIDKMIDNFINANISDIQIRVSSSEHILNNSIKRTTTSDYVEFALNYFIAYNNMNDLMEGDSKFYNDGQDFLKRAKEALAGGIPFGIINYRTDPYVPIQEINSILSSGDSSTGEIDYLHKINGRGIGLRTGYRAITINNTVNMSQDSKNLVDALVKKGVFDQETAEEYMSYFGRNKTNDAQSYITFEEWVRRITAMGEYHTYSSLINKICTNQPLNTSDIDAFIQVQKNFGYELYYNKEYNIEIPRQIKNAEFVLIPQLLTYDVTNEDGSVETVQTDLYKLYDFMSRYDINQINTKETSKAGKSRILTLWDNEGVANWEEFEAKFDKANDVEQFSYNYLYRQQEVPQHVDEENKLGVQVAKKLIDNIPDYSTIKDTHFNEDGSIKDNLSKMDKERARLSLLKEKYLNLVNSKIISSFKSFGRAIDLEVDENNNIKIDEETGEVKINAEVLYAMLRDEAKRLGVTSNELDYMTIDPDTGMPKMPSDFTIFSNKFENIVQSMINKYITRQTLPGFHAAQVTGLGFGNMFKGRNSEIKTVSDWKGNPLRYHPLDKNGNATNYIEVVVPKFSVFDGMTDEEIFKVGDDGKNMLERLGIDKIIGYRIPTEGKQSVAVMKIVGFVEKAQGSTIIVPDDWVAQTGADFDVDSIYAINYKLFKDSKGHIRKFSMNYGDTTKDIIIRYAEYVREARADYHKKTKKYKKTDIPGYAAAKANLDFYKSEQERMFEKLTGAIAQRKLDNITDSDVKSKYLEIINSNMTFIEKSEAIVKELGGVREPNIKKLVAFNREFLVANNKYLSSLDEIKNLDGDDLSFMRDYYQDLAKETGLLSYAEFEKLPVVEQNTRTNKDSEILDIMLDIASSDAILEETVSRSHFRDIIGSRDKLMSLRDRVRRKNRSPYNPFDQIDYQEDAMSGAILKAFSVSRDTFCSICNKVRPTYNRSIDVLYDGKYDFETLKNRFGENRVKRVYDTNGEQYFIVSHDKLGWSHDNRNIDNKFITVYTSETTAYHLDAVKEGSIPNLNTLTFGVYKTIVDFGSNYDTAVGFIMQPGIKAINNAYDASRSIFSREFGVNYVDSAIKSLARNMGLTVDRYTPIDTVLEKLNSSEYINTVKEYILPAVKLQSKEFIFGKDEASIYNFPLSAKLLEDRLKETGIFDKDYNSDPAVVNKIRNLFDIIVALQYHGFSNMAENITNYAMVCSPDKFGAKQSVFNTRKVFDDIDNLLSRGANAADIPLYVVGNDLKKHDMLTAIYPDIDKGFDSYISSKRTDSAYPTLNSYLKYSSGTSVVLGRQLFKTQADNIREGFLDIAKVLGVKISEKLYNDFKNYTLLDKLYQNSTIDDDEINRLLGYNAPLITDFEYKDINSPTDEEKENFKALTPAQKVEFVNHHFEDSLVFSILKTNVFNNRDRHVLPKQTIMFMSDDYDIEYALDLYRRSYFNKNFYARETARDLINYAIAAEGFSMRRNGISRIIPNDVLIDCGVNESLDVLKNASYIELFPDRVYTDFVRSHSSLVKLYNITKESGFTLTTKNGKFMPIYFGNMSDVINDISKTVGVRSGIVTQTDDGAAYPSYIKMKNSIGTTVLMKAYMTKNNDLYYYPMNTLEEFEHSTWSYNEANNRNYSENAYIAMCDEGGQITDSISRLVSDARYEAKKRNGAEENFNINDSKFDNIRNEIIKDANKYTAGKENAYFFSSVEIGRGSSNHRSLIKVSSDQVINGINYTIIPLKSKVFNLKKFNSPDTKITDLLHHIARLKKSNSKNAEDELNKLTSGLNKSLLDILDHLENYLNDRNNLTDAGQQELALMYVAIPSETKATNVKFSTLEDAATSLYSAVRSDISKSRNNPHSLVSDDKSFYTIQNLTNNNIIKENVKDKVNTTLSVLKPYIAYATQALKNRVTDFNETLGTEIEPVSIDSDEVFARVRTDREYRDNYLKFIMDYDSFVKNYAIINSMYSDDAVTNDIIKDIQRNYSEITSPYVQNKIANAKKRFLVEYISKDLSTDPLMQDEIFNVTDGFNKITPLESWLSDSLEAGIPLMQVVLTDVLSDVYGKEIQAKKAAVAWAKDFDSLTKSGEVDFDHFITPDGTFFKDYNETLVQELKSRTSELNALKQDPNIGVFHPTYLKKDLEYRKWLTDNFERFFVKTYYDDYLKIEDDIISSFPEILGKYKELNNEISLLRQAINNNEADDSAEARLLDLQNKLFILRGGDLTARKSMSSFTDTEKAKLYSKEAIEALKKYIDSKKELDRKYCEKMDIEAFNEELAKRLATIRNIELNYGGILPTEDVLMANKDYAAAIKWIRYNAKLVFKDNKLKDKTSKAFDTLRYDHDESKSRTYMARVAKARDIYGIVDARQLSSDDISKIKEYQEGVDLKRFGGLIKPILDEGIYYTNDFFKPLLGGIKNAKYEETVSSINNILGRACRGMSSRDRVVDLSILNEDELDDLYKLYIRLGSKKMKKYISSKPVRKARRNYIAENIEITVDDAAFEAQRLAAEAKANLIGGKEGTDYYKAWLRANTETTSEGEEVPNRYLYGVMRPKGLTVVRDSEGYIKSVNKECAKFVDIPRSNANKTIRDNIKRVPTMYYYLKEREMRNSSTGEDYRAWFLANHTYDRVTGNFTPLMCWTRTEYVNSNMEPGAVENDSYAWEQSQDRIYSRVKKEFRNNSYKKGGIRYNYRKGNAKYDNPDLVKLTPQEQAVKDHMIKAIEDFTYGNQRDRMLDEGELPLYAKENEAKYSNPKWYAKQMGTLLGFVDYSDQKDFHENPDYAHDSEYELPLTKQLRNIESKKEEEIIPRRKYSSEHHKDENGNPMSYEEYVDKVKKKNEEIRKNNAEVQRAIINRDWKTVFSKFIEASGRAKAIEENKAMMYFALETLRDMEIYKKPVGFFKLWLDKFKSTEEHSEYRKENFDSGVKLMETFIRRLCFDAKKKNNGFLTKGANVLQNSASARFMGLNVTGGIVNVTYGETQIWQEIAAKQFVDISSWNFANRVYGSKLHSYIAEMYSETSSNKPNALIKLFRVIDTDAVLEINTKGVSHAFKVARDVEFGMQSSGEHSMQNRMLFAMMNSHRVKLIFDPNDNTKVIDVKLVTKELNARDAEKKAFDDTLKKFNLTEQYNIFKEPLKTTNENFDAEETRAYVERHKFIETKFLEKIYKKNKEAVKFYIDEVKKNRKAADKEWNNLSTLYDQFELDSDGYANIIKGSDIDKLEDKTLLWKKIGRFRNKVIYVNKKIHGVYDQLGAARLEQEWYGSLLMQFHKHLYPGIMKRFRRQGYYNEARESIEKGSVTSLTDFLTVSKEEILNFSELTYDEKQSMLAMQNVFKTLSDYCSLIYLRWHLMPDSERSNIIRCFTDLAFVALNMGIAVSAKVLWDEKDKKDSIIYNLLMHTIDRTEMELQLYTLWGARNEVATIWKNPAVVIATVDDILKIMDLSTEICFTGNTSSMYYANGPHAKENKYSVWIPNLFPGVRAINHLNNLPKNNKAYKLKANGAQKFANKIASAIAGREITR